MKKLLALLLIICVIFCSVACSEKTNEKSVSSTNYSAESIALKIQGMGLPMNNIIAYTADTDLNNLMGQPNQYISKINFADTGLKQLDATDPNGGTIEVFNNSDDLNARVKYIKSVYDEMPGFRQTIVINGNYMLRLSNALTKTEVSRYTNAFMDVD